MFVLLRGRNSTCAVELVMMMQMIIMNRLMHPVKHRQVRILLKHSHVRRVPLFLEESRVWGSHGGGDRHCLQRSWVVKVWLVMSWSCWGLIPRAHSFPRQILPNSVAPFAKLRGSPRQILGILLLTAAAHFRVHCADFGPSYAPKL